MADQTQMQTQFEEIVAPLFNRQGPAAFREAGEILAKNARLATVITYNGANAVDVALANKTPWLARELAVTAQLHTHPEQKPAYEQKLAAALEADRKQRPASSSADLKVRQKLQDEWLLALDEKTLTPAAKSMQRNIRLETWKQQQDTKTELGESYIHIAAAQDRPDVMAWMYEQAEAQLRGQMVTQANVSRQNFNRIIKSSVDSEVFSVTVLDGQTPLIVAARNGKADTVDYLMRKGAFPREETSNGGNAAYYAAIGNHKDVLEVLDNHSFPIHQSNGKHGSPLDTAMKAGSKEAVAYLAESAKKNHAGVQSYLNHALSSAQTPEMAKLIIDLGADPKNKGGADYTTPLVAIGGARESALVDFGIEKVKVDTSGLLDVLLEKGADPNISRGGFTPLQAAIFERLDNKDIIKLLEKTTNLRETDGRGGTALHNAVNTENAEILKLLIKKDPGLLEITDKEGRTPLLRAVEQGNIKIVRELAEISNKDAIDNYKNSAMHTAVSLLAASHDKTPKKELEDRLETIKLVRTNKNANIPLPWDKNSSKSPAQLLQHQVDELKERMKIGQPLTPSEINKLDVMNRAIKEILQPQKTMGIAAPQLEDAIKKAADTAPKPGDVSLSTPSEKAAVLPTKPNNPTLAV